MPKRIQDLFKNNQEWIVNGLSSSKLSAAAYGRQALQYSSQYVGTNFFGDINLATGSAVTSQVAKRLRIILWDVKSNNNIYEQ